MSEGIYTISVGRAHPLGATPEPGGVNFSVFSWNATGVELLLFACHDDLEPLQIVSLDPRRHRTYGFWHCFVEGLQPCTHYAYRVDGPEVPEQGHRFDRAKILIDPYARGNTNALWKREDACGDGDNLYTSMRSIVIDAHDYDWEGDKPLHRCMQDTILYEMHVGGFTKSASSSVRHPGTFCGLIEKIPYLQALGITAVELLPVMEFDETEILRVMEDGTQLFNYWGYSTLSFFAPEGNYCVSPELGHHLNEFRDMVKALHQAGIEPLPTGRGAGTTAARSSKKKPAFSSARGVTRCSSRPNATHRSSRTTPTSTRPGAGLFCSPDPTWVGSPPISGRRPSSH